MQIQHESDMSFALNLHGVYFQFFYVLFYCCNSIKIYHDSYTSMILSEQSVTAIIVCLSLGISFTLLFLLCIRYDLFTKIARYCSAGKVQPHTVVPKVLTSEVLQSEVLTSEVLQSEVLKFPIKFSEIKNNRIM